MKKILLATLAFLWLLTGLGGRLVAQENIAVWKFPSMQDNSNPVSPSCVSDLIQSTDCELTVATDGWTYKATDLNNPNTVLCDENDETKGLRLTNTNGNFTEASIVFKISAAPYGSIRLTYDHKISAIGGYETETWSYSTNGVSFTEVTSITGATTTYATEQVDFSSVSALNGMSSVWFKLTVSGATVDNAVTAIDNVVFTGSPMTCLKPINVTAVANDPHSAVISWDPQGTNEESYTLVYYTSQLSTTALNTLVNTSDAHVIANATSPYTLTGLNGNTTYHVYLRANCVGDDNSIWTDDMTFTTPEPVVHVITIGDGTSKGHLVPVNTYYNYSLSQQIYTADDIEMAGTISSVAFYFDYTQAFSFEGIKLYMKHTTKSSFASNTDMVSLADATLVYDGVFGATSAGWITLQLSTPFEYNGTDNLLICMYDPTDGFASDSHVFRYTGTGDNYTSIMYYSDNNIPDINSVSSFSDYKTYNKYHNNIQLGIAPNGNVCFRVSDVVATNITASSAVIGWTVGGEETAWTLKYGPAGFDVETAGTEVSVENTPSYSLSGLTANTAYDVYVKAVCGATEESRWTRATFTTYCNAQAIPYTVDFESFDNYAVPNCWTQVATYTSGTYTYPCVYNSTTYGHNSSSKSLRMYTYYYYNAPENIIAMSPMDDINTLQVQFWARYYSTNPQSFQVGYVKNGEFTAVQTISGLTATYQQFTVYMSEVPADAEAIAFRSYHASSSSYVHIDDIEVSSLPTCVEPQNIVVSNITATTASVSWTDVLPTTEWQYQLNNGEIIDVYAKPIELTGLTANTEYTIKIRSACAGEYSDWATVATFTTSCNAIIVDVDHQFSEDFTGLTSTTFPPQCWSQERTAVGTGSLGTDYPNGAWTCYTSTQGTGSNPPMAQLRDSRAGARHNLVTAPLSMATGRYIVSVRVYRGATGTDHTVEGINLYLSKTSDLVSAGNDAVDLGFISRNYTVASGVNSEIIGAESGIGWYTYNIPFDISSDGVYYVIFEGRNNYGLSTFMDDVLVRTASSAAEITAFSFAEDAEAAVINSTDATVTSVVSYQTESLNGLVPTIAISDYATIAPASGVAQDFTGPVTYTVTAEDGTTTKEWTVNVSKVATASSAKDILSFSFSGQQGESVINPENHTVLAYVAWNYDLNLATNKIAPTITVSPLATIYPVSDSAINFANPVTYTVTAEDESTQEWTVTIENDPNACVNPLPATFVVSDLTPSTATVAWERRYIETSYNVKVSTTAISVSDIATTDGDFYNGVVNDTTITLTGLAENTMYYVYVQSACGIETWVSKSFRTIVTPATIPYVYAFEDAAENNNWVLLNGSQTNKWYIGTASSNSGNGLYISSNNGESNIYSNTSSSSVYAYRLINLEAAGEYIVAFDWKSYGESRYNGYDVLNAYLVSGLEQITAGSSPSSSWILATNNSSGLEDVTTWQHSEKTVDIATSGNYILAFFWKNDNSGGDNPPATVDNISITRIACPTVADMIVSDITTTSADITWTERGPATAWDVVFSATALTDEQLAAATPEPVTAASYHATELTQNTPYYIYVRAHCSDEDQSDWVASQFRTECGEKAIPYSQNFNDYTATSYSTAGVMPDCWRVNYSGTSQNYAPHVCNYSYYGPGSDNYLIMIAAQNETVGQYSYAIFPHVEGGYANRFVSFDKRISSVSNGTLSLGYMNGNNFVSLTDVTVTTSGSSFSYIVPNTVPSEAMLAFRLAATSTSYAYLGIDNVLVRETATDNTILSYSASTEQGDAICAVDNDAHTISVVLRSGYVAGAAVSQVLTVNEEHATAKQQIGGDFVDVPATFSWYMTTADTTLSFKVIAENGDEQPYTATVTVESCAAPSALVAEQTSTTNVNCSWTPAEGTEVWNFYCSTTQMTPAGLDALTASDYTTVTTASASATVVGETTYYWYVRADCGGSYSAWMESSFTTWENCVAPTNLATEVVNDNNIVVSWNVQDNLPLGETNISDDFERSTIDGGPFTYSNDATYPWVITTAAANGGSHSIKSGNYNVASSTSSIVITANYPTDGTLSFYGRVSSEQTSVIYDWDYGTFYIDGEQQGDRIVNSTSFSHFTYNVPAGSHTFMWRYKKDGYNNTNYDCFYVDDITINYQAPSSSVVVYKNDAELVTLPATTTSYTDEGLEAGNYCYKVKTICREGSESEFSAPVCQDINACMAVTNMSATNVTATSATISWTRGSDETAWNITINGGSQAAINETSENVTVNENVISYALAGLEPMTDYTVTIQSDCGGSVSQSVATVNFTTERVPATLPYTCDFENAVENNGWVLLNGTQTNTWYIGTAAYNSGANGLYITNDNGTSNAYDNASTSYVYAYRTINVENASDYTISFNWKAYAESCCDYIRAFLVPADITINANEANGIGTTGAPTNWIAIDGGSNLNNVSSWQTVSNVFSIEDAGNYNLVFYWKNDYSTGSNPPAAIDNVSVIEVSCPTVANITADPDDITNNSAVITWTERGSAEAWEVVVSATEVTDLASATAIPVTEATYPATGLNAETTYHVYVRANCDVDDNSEWAHATFTTVADCPNPDGLASSTSLANLTTITWNGYTASNWTFEYRLGTTGDWTVVENVDAATYTITTTPTTTYNVRVKAVCGVDEESAYSTIFSFTTPCGAIAEFPWNEGFENGIDCWTLVDADGDGEEWYQANVTGSDSSLGNHGGSYIMTSASYAGVALTPNNWLISPALDLSALSGTVKMSYFVGGQDMAWYEEHYKVCVSTTTTDVASFSTVLLEETLPSEGWLERNVDLSAYVGQTIYVAFVHYDCTDMFRLDLDDISVYVDNSTDAAITGITAPTHGDYSTCALTDAEQIKINILNNGGAAISDFEVSYTINNGTPVTETVTASVAPAQTYEYTFAQTVDLSTVGTYTISASINLTGDETDTNNSASITITSGDATVRIHALTDSYSTGGGQSWIVTNTITNEVVAERTTAWQWNIEINDYICVDASQCYSVVVNDADGMSSPAYLEILYNDVQVAGSTEPGSFTGPSLVAERFSPACQSSENDIITFSVPDMLSVDIDNDDHTVTAEISYASTENLSAIVPTITVSEYAEITLVDDVAYVAGNAQDFTNPVVYTVVAENGTPQTWNVIVTRSTVASSEKDIIAFTFAGQVGESVIDPTGHTVTAFASWNISLEDPITPTIVVSPMATINPASGVAQNFSAPVTYTVTAEDQSTQEWTVTITQDSSTMASLPYTCNFEDATENANWVLENGNELNNWYIGAATNHGGANGLYISDDNGASYHYNTTDGTYSDEDRGSYVYAYRQINVAETGHYDISFDWLANGEGSYDLLRAFAVPLTSGSTLVAGNANGMTSYTNTNPTGWIDIANPTGILNQQTEWQTSDATIELNAGAYNLVFFWKNDYSGGSQTPAAVDNVSIARSTFTITASAEGLGSITPVGDTVVADGATVVFTMTPMSGFALSALTVDGVDQLSQVVNNTYTFENVSANHTIVATFEPAIIINATAGNGGSISPAGEVSVGAHSNATFTITAGEGYIISSVLVDNEEVLNDNTVRTTYNYTFTNVTASHTIAASFVAAEPHYITANASAGGSISPSGRVEVAYNGSQTFEFTPDEGYSLANIVVDNGPATAENNTYTFTNVIDDHTINANFTVNSYNLTIHYVYADNTTATPDHTESVAFGAEYLVASPEIAGYTADQLTVAGTMPAQDVEVTVTYNVNSYTLTIHYVYADQTVARPDYTAQVAYGAEYSVESPVVECYTADQLTVAGTMPAQDVEVNVIYNVDTYTLTVHYVYADNTEAATTYTETVACGETYSVPSPVIDGYTADPAVVEGTMPANDVDVTVTYNEIVTHTLTIHYVYAETNAQAAADHTETLAEGAAYSVTSPVIDGYTASQTVVEGTMGTSDIEVTVRYTSNTVPTYTLTIHYVYAETNAQAAADHTETLAEGAAYSVTSPVIDGYTADQATVAGTMPAQNVEVTVRYTANTATTYTITATAGNGGTITPNGTITVNEGADQSFTITPNAGYRIASVLVDNADATSQLVNGVYTFTNVRANHTIVSTFEPASSTTYTITASAGNGGTITPNNVVTVAEGANQTFRFTPDNGFRIATVVVDGNNVMDEVVDYSYTFYDVRANHTIYVTFTDGDAVDEYTTSSMSVYPNPNNGMFSIDFSRIEGDATYQLIDARGAVVETRDINVMDGDTMNFNHDLRPGTYFVRIVTADKVYVEQIVVE